MPTLQLPEFLYTAEGTRELDRRAIESGIAGNKLMERAGAGAFSVLRRNWPEAREIVVFCGGGNNGGDGYVIARLAKEAGLRPRIVALAGQEKLKGDALTMAQLADKAGVPLEDDPQADLQGVEVVVDALLGTGLQDAPRGAYESAIKNINASDATVLAVDIPSGLNADSGAVAGEVVSANATVTFIGVNQGLLTGRGPGVCGRLYFDNLRVPQEVFDAVAPSAVRPCHEDIAGALPTRPRDAHKGQFGHVLLAGGDYGFAGAVTMAGQAAARCGAGLVSLATRPENCAAVLVRQPELMAHGISENDQFAALLKKASVLVVGPGLGQSDWAAALLQQALASDLPLLLDADALNLLAAMPALPKRQNWVLTPHPGEAARLLGTDTASIQADRFAALEKLIELTGATVLLKGAGTLVGSPGKRPPTLISFGNPGMATGGMGDVLSGIIGALLGQGLDTHNAASMGALTHAVAADYSAAEQGERGMLATDLLPWLRLLLNGKR